MARYVDGFVIPIPKKNLAAYRRLSRAAGVIWMEHGALGYVEAAGDDLGSRKAGYARTLKLARNETAMFSWIEYRSRAHRDRVNRKVLKDPRIAAMMVDQESPFDVKRMLYGGFAAIVDLG